MVAEPFAQTQKDPFLRVVISAEQTHQRLGVAEGVIRESQEQGPRSTLHFPSRNETSPQSNRNEVTKIVGEAEESVAISGRKEVRPESENLVVLGMGLLWSVLKQAMKSAERSLMTAGKFSLHHKPPRRTTSRTLFKLGKNLEQRHGGRTGDMPLAILLSMCPTDPENVLTTLEHLFPDSAQMRVHIVTVINSRARGPPQMMMGNLNEQSNNNDASSNESEESEGGELFRLELRNGKKVSTTPRRDSSEGNTKGGEKSITYRECSRCGLVGHIRGD